MRRERKPLSATVAGEIKAKILDGSYPPESQLPPETDFAVELEVSRATLREALALLEREGLVTRLHGIGSFVRAATTEVVSSFGRPESMLELIARSGFQATNRVLESGRGILDADACAALELPPDSEGYSFESLYSANGIPLIYTQEHAPLDIFPREPVAGRDGSADLADFIARNTDHPPVATLTRLKGVLPPERLMGILMIDANSPVIRQRFTLYDRARRPVGCGYDYLNSSWFEFTIYNDAIRL